jgi:hypothetical protein
MEEKPWAVLHRHFQNPFASDIVRRFTPSPLIRGDCIRHLNEDGMERRAASHTEEEEMNQRRRLLNAAKKGDQKAIAKLFELYQVRVYNNEMVSKLNRTAGTHKLQAEVAQAKAAAKGGGSSRKSMPKKSVPSSSRQHGKAGPTRTDKKVHRKK